MPVIEQNSLNNQRNDRKMYIGAVDKVMTKSICVKPGNENNL